jgi:HK97 family phage major capsid protein
MRMTELQLEQLIQKRVLEELKKPIGGKIPYNGPAYGSNDIDRTDSAGFSGIGDFLKSIKNNDFERLRNCIPREGQFKDLEEGSGAGQYLIPSAYRAQMLDLLQEAEICRPRSTQFTLKAGEGKSLTIPGVDLTDFNTNNYAGISVYAQGEKSEYSESDAVLRQITLTLHKCGALCDITDELLFSSAVDVNKMIMQLLVNAMAWQIDRWIINTGTGAGEILSILNGSDIKTVDAEDGQSADEYVVYENVTKMLEAMNPRAWKSSVFLASPSLVHPILQMSKKVGTAGNSIQVLNFDNYTWKLLGLPIIFTEHCPAAGSAGALMLANFKGYATLSRGDFLIRQTQSDASKFRSDINTVKITAYLDGMPIQAGTTTLADGTTTVANFVKLGAVT